MDNNVGIKKLRRCKSKLRRLNDIVSKYIDYGTEDLIDPESLHQLLLISQIDELLTDVIYYIIDNNNLYN